MPQQWEYVITGVQVDLDKMGMDGWELVTVDGSTMFWKRPGAAPGDKTPMVSAQAAPKPKPPVVTEVPQGPDDAVKK